MEHPPASIAYSPDGTHIAVANFGLNTVSIIKTSDYKVIDTITVGTGPVSVAYSPDGNHIAVANSASNSSGNYTVSIIDTSTYTVTQTVTSSAFEGPYSVAYSPDGSHIAAANVGSDTVSIIKTSDYTLTHTVPVGSGPRSVAYSPLAALASHVNITGPDGYSQNKVSISESQNSIITKPIIKSGKYL